MASNLEGTFETVISSASCRLFNLQLRFLTVLGYLWNKYCSNCPLWKVNWECSVSSSGAGSEASVIVS